MKLSMKLSLVTGTLTLFILVVGIFGLFQMNAINKGTSVLAGEWLPAIVAIEEMNTAFSDFRIYEVQHVFSTDAQAMAEYEKKMADASAQVMIRIKAYEAIPMAPEGRRVYENYRKTRAAYIALHDDFIKLSRENKTDEAIALLNGKGLELYTQSSGYLQDIVNRNVEGGKKASADATATFESARITILSLIVASLLIALTVAVYIIRSTMGQLGKDPGELGAVARSVAGGNLELPDEVNPVGVYADIRVMVENLKEHIGKAQKESENAHQESIKAQEAMQKAEVASKDAQAKRDGMLLAADRLEEVAGVVSSASTELSAQIEQSERGASEQAARVTETATAMEEMNSTVVEVAKNAGAAADVSTQTRDKAEEGARVVQEVVHSMHSVQKASLVLKEDMGVLSEQAQSISQIMGVISDIADQTNLLALNAAIEAARAGEYGRGFAVVADEVRKLAEKTMASTTDVGEAIRSIQESAHKSMAQVDSTVENIEQATGLAGKSGEALQEIVKMVDSTADQVRAIATASEQQSASSEEINRSIVQVNGIASETARAMEEAAKAVSDLAGQAQVLSRLIDDMKRA